jgi:RHS repeat-associated protein
MLVYGTVASTNPNEADIGEKIAAYDYRAFGEMLELTPLATGKVTENFTGSRFARRTQRTACKSIAEPKNLGAKRNEHDDEIALDYFGARYLDPMLGMWTSVDPARQFASPYLYAGNGVNPVNVIDPDGNMNIFVYGGRIIYADDDDNDPVVHAHFPGGFNYDFIAPPKNSYLFSRNENGTLNIIGERFDFYIDPKAKRIII